jgi:transcriptional regulator with XRE-family HTH domain
MSRDDESHQEDLGALGEFIRSQRRMAKLSLRDLATRTKVSNPYLSQIERGLHEPSVRVLRAIALALDLSAETLLFQAGLLGDDSTKAAEGEAGAAPAAIRADSRLTEQQKQALLAVYHSYLAVNRSPAGAALAPSTRAGDTATTHLGNLGNGPTTRTGTVS